MKNLKFYKIIITLLLIATVVSVGISTANDAYSIPDANINLQVQPNGTLNVEETINYNIEDTINGVYRVIPISGQQSVENMVVETPGLYNRVEQINNSHNITLKVYLYKDPEMTQKISNQNVKVIYKYDFLKMVKVYNDIAELHYKPWGVGWDSSVSNLETQITLPSNHQDTEYWNNPPTKVINSEWINDTTLKTTINDISPKEQLEQRILIPKTQLDSNPTNADIINKDAKTTIEKQQQNYENNLNFQKILNYVVTIALIIMIVSPFGLYLKYGKEPKIDYDSKYETDLPSTDHPAIINAIVDGNVGEIDAKGFQASILDLIDKKYIKVKTIVGEGKDQDTILKITNKNQDTLVRSQLELINYMQKFANDTNGDISLKDMKENQDPEKFKKFFDIWQSDILNDESLTSEKLETLFNDTGDQIFKVFGILGLIIAILLIVFKEIILPLYGEYVVLLSMILLFESVILLALPNTIGGQWTKEGRTFNEKWHSFKRYVCDYSMMKEYPPGSVQVWGRYLVYATALGVSEEITKNMKSFLPEEELANNDLILFNTYGGNILLASALTEAFDSNNGDNGSFGDIGNVGGGGGGGGGGVF